MPTQLINGLTYHYDLSGPADNPSGAPTLVLLHGFTGSAANWRDVAPALAQTHRVLAVNLLGHGETDAPAAHARYAMAHTARDLVDLLTVTVGQPVHLLGYSMGGRLALYTALHFGEAMASLILESASPGLRTQVERAERRDRDEALAERIEREGVAAFVDFWERISLFATQEKLPPAARAHLREQRLRSSALGLANSLRGMGTGAQPSLWDDLAAWSKPTLLITGEQDGKFCEIAGEMAESLPHAAWVSIAEAGHTVHLEQPRQFVATVERFLSG